MLVIGPAAAAQAAARHNLGHRPNCGPAHAGSGRCFSDLLTVNGQPLQTATPAGYGPADLRSAYNLKTTGGANQTVGIVDAYDDPSAESDLATYRSTFGLPSCTTANGCFRKVDENGGDNFPKANTGWDFEIALDLEMVSAICPNCKILLVEASNEALSHLGPAENTAASLGATEISNSWGQNESNSDPSYDKAYFAHPGIALVAASGDSGFGVAYPATSPNVTAVGGTSLQKSSSKRGWTETAWGLTGSGCSKVEAKPAWQTDTGCGDRTIVDVAAVADPTTGVALFFAGSWYVIGGTSVGSPVIAAVFALAGNAASLTGAASAYAPGASLYDVTGGSNGTCAVSYLCTAGIGYDGPTGNGTPNGTGAF
jgi:subtilase family serine protease